MKKIRIVNKKVFSMFILTVVALLAVVVFLIFNVIKIKNKPKDFQGDVGIEKQKIQENFEKVEAVESSVGEVKADEINEAMPEQAQSISLTEYENQKYSYNLRFPDGWYMNSDFAESVLEKTDLDGSREILAGGQVFWSNYENINEYSPESKPENFHLLGLTIYQVDDFNFDSLALTLGFDEDAIAKKKPFEGKNTSGYEYVSFGDDEKNPEVAIMFAKNNYYFVFNLGFIGGNAQAAETMEGIVSALTLR